ncbi:MAG: hypothetical protein AUI36_11230 [Cyanobacteria bacterium 13_1_40CM_2_61_4]|nr:MAG: hypothetical protein AUI36_11230 [Cyanobacteria bacterium 13_1_40CM_2_61_4]
MSAASFTSTPRRQSYTFFVDRDLGRKIVPQALRDAGAQVEIHDDHFPQGALDAEWLPEVGRRGWVLVTKDREIRYRAAEREALLNAGVRAFVLRTRGLSGPDNAQILVRALPRMVRFCIGNPPPFIAAVLPSGGVTMLFRESRRRRRRRRAPRS